MSQFCIIIREEGNDISSYYSLTKALNLIRKYELTLKMSSQSRVHSHSKHILIGVGGGR